jgi:hypothetical protein
VIPFYRGPGEITMIRPRKNGIRLAIEALEERTLHTAYVVDTALDDPTATATDTDGLVSLREAIQAASTNAAFGDASAGQADGAVDRIAFDPALTGKTIFLGGEELTVTDNLALTGLGPKGLAISGNNASRVFTVKSGVMLSIAGMTIADGLADEGGAIYNDGGTLSIVDSVFSGNFAYRDGGAIVNSFGTLSIENTTFCTILQTAGAAVFGTAGHLTSSRASSRTTRPLAMVGQSPIEKGAA